MFNIHDNNNPVFISKNYHLFERRSGVFKEINLHHHSNVTSFILEGYATCMLNRITNKKVSEHFHIGGPFHFAEILNVFLILIEK